MYIRLRTHCLFPPAIGCSSEYITQSLHEKMKDIISVECSKINGDIVHFLNKNNHLISIYTFRILPFPAMISLLVYSKRLQCTLTSSE